MINVDLHLGELLPKKYVKIVMAFLSDAFSYYCFYGGRGGVKSSIAGLLLVITTLTKGNGVAIRRYASGIRNSIFQECLTAISRLGLDNCFTYTVSPLCITCTLTGYSIYFRGLDDPQKIKSLKATLGNFRCLVIEECQEIEEESKCRSVVQTLGRGGEHLNVLYVFNPPNAKSHWTNATLRESTKHLFSLWVNYLDVPRKWLGDQFYEEADRLKSIDIDLYNFEYLGIVGSNKGKVFKNVEDLRIDKSKFTTLQRGLDFGLAKDGDPSAYVVCHYEAKDKTLYICDEWYKKDSTYPEIAKAIKAENKNDFTVFCDSADSGGIKQMKIEGVHRAKGCKKGKVENGITWLRGLNHIYIDSEKCPETFREFSEYAWVLQKASGDLVLNEKDNHSIDAVRYALSDYIKY